ncbi:hypothetical protein BJX99DRAFT_222364 [Aspergillus californicus]
MARDAYLVRSLGTQARRIKESRVLLVGAGGIGCELLKNLLLTGFGEIHLIDLDTIDLSNLNRQFLFRREHIKKSKALVAKEVAQKFQPSARIEAYHANIKDSQFSVGWFSTFAVVFNALDNLDARRHVNRMCLAADVPLIESGTSGFNGQVQVIKKNKTECYDCNPKELPKTYPVCTIRSTPSQPIHCIVWAKSYLLPELFGSSETDTEGFDHSADAANAQEIENLLKEAQALKDIRNSMGSAEFTQKVFDMVFKKDIERLRGMEDMWKSRKAPEALNFEEMQKALTIVPPEITADIHKAWTLHENMVVFKDSLDRLSKRSKPLQDPDDASSRPIIEFDKDDVDTLDFVTASANLRAEIFGIDRTSQFNTKEIAGRIIPAIATTNAMTAGLCVLQAFKVLRDDYENAKMVFLERSGTRAINSGSLNAPNPHCHICSTVYVTITINLARATLGDLVEKVLRQQLEYGEEFSINTEQGTIYDPDLEDNLPRQLTELGIKPLSFLTVVDGEDQPRVNLDLYVVEPAEALPKEDHVKPNEESCILDKVPDIPRKPRASTPTPAPKIEQTNGTSNLGKRKRGDNEIEVNGDPPTKRVASVSISDGVGQSNFIHVDEDEGGAILIDD